MHGDARGGRPVRDARHQRHRPFRGAHVLQGHRAPADGLWIAWPKKASKLETDLDFDAVQSAGLAAGLVDNKSCSIDESWQALRFVYRLMDR